MRIVGLLAFALLCACGADDEPEPVSGGTGISVSGEARIGVAGSF